MKRKYRIKYLIVALLGLSLVCSKRPEKIPTGRWNYKLYVNASEVGTAVISNSFKDGRYISSTEMTMKTGDVVNMTRQIVTETADFKPLRLETYNRIDQGGKSQRIDTVALFKGRTVELTTGAGKKTLLLEKDFILEGNYFLAKLIEGKFRKGLELKADIYDPAIELEEPIPLKVLCLGRETIEIFGKSRTVYHISETIEGIKGIDLYFDEEGVLLKGVIIMLNLAIELVRI